MRILIIKMSSLGDVIHTIPMVGVLKKNLPNAQIDWVVNEEYSCLLKGNPNINEVIPFKRRDWLNLIGFIKNRREIKKFAMKLKSKRYDVVLDVQGLFKSALVVMMAHGKKNIGFSNAREFASFWYNEKVEGDYTKHAVERYLQLLEPLNLKWTREELEFFIPSTQRDRESLKEKLGDLYYKNFVVFCPFTRWDTKRWEEENFYELERLLNQKGIDVVWIGARNEFLKKDVKNNFIGKFTLLELYELMKLSKFVITCDSGAMHIASSAGANIFALFGPTSHIRTGPYNLRGKNFIIRKEDLYCSPCFEKECKRKDKFCLEISPKEVFDRIANSGLI
ncbi:MAG: lipopolysaccharide heptosyltransferase I [Proteobacteria bacterium]|nr:lipopolysaccharide heptosyltransferase I [Pseudomonadota bacterium]